MRQKVEASLEVKNQLLAKVYNRRALSIDAVVEELLSYVERLRPMVADTSLLLNRALDDGQTVLFEGAQATMLDVDHGTYPFVTSSNPIAGGVCTGAGVGPTRIDRVIGVIKAYTTRVGSGPFPTELFDADGEKLWKVGGEVGVSTGRNRRCGWYDAVVARYSSRVNGLTDLFLTKLDVLSSWERVPVCVAYDVDGVRHDEMPMTQSEFARAKPIYETLPGWWEDISGCRDFDALPANAQAYVRAWRRCPAPASGASASAPAASRPSSYRPERTGCPGQSLRLLGRNPALGSEAIPGEPGIAHDAATQINRPLTGGWFDERVSTQPELARRLGLGRRRGDRAGFDDRGGGVRGVRAGGRRGGELAAGRPRDRRGWSPTATPPRRRSSPRRTRGPAAPTSTAARCSASGGASWRAGGSWSARRPAVRRWR